MCTCTCTCVCVCRRKTKDRADGMKEKSAHCPRRDSNLYLWDTRPLCFRLHHDGRHTSRQSKQTLQTLTSQLDRETIMHETLQLLSAGPRRQASARTSAESDKACQRKTKDRADGMKEKSAHCPRRDSNLYLWDTCPLCFQLHHDDRHASRQSKQCVYVTMNNNKKNAPTCRGMCHCGSLKRGFLHLTIDAPAQVFCDRFE